MSLAVRFLPQLPWSAGGAPLVSTLFHLGGAVLAMAFYLVFLDHQVLQSSRLRPLMFLGCLLFAAGLYAYSRWTAGPLPPVLEMLGTANLLVLAMVLGSWLTTALKRPAELVPVCLVMSLVDIFSVARGPSRFIAGSVENFYQQGRRGIPPLGDFLLVKITLPGSPVLFPVFGLTDWIIVVFLSAAAIRFGYNDNLLGRGLVAMRQNKRPSFYLPVSAAGLALAVIMAQVGGLFLPALPIIAVLFLGYVFFRYPLSRQLQPSDWTLMLTSCGIMAVVLLLPLI